MPATLTYTVPGKPVTWARARRRGNRHFTAPKQNAAKAMHNLAAVVALGRGGRARWPLTGAFAVEVVGVYSNAVVGDVDRLASLPLDALEGLLWKSDRQVRKVSASISTGPVPHTHVVVRRLESDPVQRARGGMPKAPTRMR